LGLVILLRKFARESKPWQAAKLNFRKNITRQHRTRAKSGGQPPAVQTLRAQPAASNRAKRLDCGCFSTAPVRRVWSAAFRLLQRAQQRQAYLF
jgi:hypothetical protein